jgi:predicted phosphodiesterase
LPAHRVDYSELFQEWKRSGLTKKQFAIKAGITQSTLYSGFSKVDPDTESVHKPGGRGAAQTQDNDTFVALPDKVDPNLDWEKLVKQGWERAQQIAEQELSQQRAVIDLSKHKEPVAIFTMSDVHIGSKQCHVPTLLEHIKLLKRIPNLYAIFQGDMMEWCITERQMDALFGQTLAPDRQAAAYRNLLEDLMEKVIAIISGNHDERAFRKGGLDVVGLILQSVKRHGIYLRDGGTLDIKMHGGVSYSWRAMHGDAMSGNSMYSHTASMARHARFQVGWADVLSSGHIHEPEVKTVWEPRADGAPKEMTILIRSGSYKIGPEQYPDRMGLIGVPEVVSPCVILFPNKKRMIAFAKLEDAIDVLAAFSKCK